MICGLNNDMLIMVIGTLLEKANPIGTTAESSHLAEDERLSDFYRATDKNGSGSIPATFWT